MNLKNFYFMQNLPDFQTLLTCFDGCFLITKQDGFYKIKNAKWHFLSYKICHYL